MSRRSLLALAFLLTTLSLALFVTGGFVTTVLGFRVSARSPVASAIAAGGAVALWAFLARRAQATADDLARADEWLSAQASAIVLTIAGVAGAVALHFASFSAAGSDASGYLSQAAMLWSGGLTRPEPLAAIADWPDGAVTLAPLGWRPAIDAGMQVPTYAVGLPLLIAPLHGVSGTIAACLMVAVSLFLAVSATGALALRIAGVYAAIVAAVWLATSPVALIEAMQPMSDVPATAAWLVCWVLLVPRGSGVGRAVLGGVVAGIAILIRPNLAPVAAIHALWLFLRGDVGRPTPVRRVVAFAAPVLVAAFTVAFFQWRWFGSPLRSGYGTAEEIFALANVGPNAALYIRWLLDTHGPWLLLAPLARFWPPSLESQLRSSFGEPRRSALRGGGLGDRTLRWLLAFAGVVIILYLLYAVFEVWTYLRFMLPALAIAMIAVASMIAALIGRLPVVARAPTFAIVVLVVAAANVVSARTHGVFRLSSTQSRAALAGRYLEASLPANAVVLAGEQSGSVRYYTQRSIVRWDFVAPDGLNAVTERLSGEGYDVWIALDMWEEELFRRKFPGSVEGALDWRPRVEAGSEMVTRAWRVRDREPFMRNEQIVTDRLR